MKKTKKLAVLLLALIMTVSAGMLSGCSGGSAGSSGVSDVQQNVTVGKRVYVDDSGIIFFGYKNLLCSAKMEGTDITEFVVEAGMTGDIYGLAIYNDEMYVAASDGFFKYPLEMFESGQSSASPTVIMKDALSSFQHFEIFEDRIFFIYGTSLYYVPVTGGEKTKVTEDIYDFDVTDNGIYYVEKDGDLEVLSPDLSEDEEVGEIPKDVRFSVGGANLYYRDGTALKSFSLEKEEVSDVGNQSGASEFYVPWSNGTNVLYSSDDFEYFLVTADGEKDLGKSYLFPDKSEGFLSGNCLASTTTDYASMQVVDLESGDVKVYELEEKLADDLSKIGGGSSNGSGSDNSGSGTSGTSDDYNITKDMYTSTNDDGSIEYMNFKDFVITMPNNEKWSMQSTPRAVTFYLFSAQQEGYGGVLCSIAAYDIDDDVYLEIPHYSEIGITKNSNKRLVAIFPTDVQWNHDDPQQEADYKELQTYMQKIGKAVNSPVQLTN